MSENNNKNRANRPPSPMMLRRTLTLMVACGIVGFVVLGARLFSLQVVQHRDLESAAISQQVRRTTITPNRGSIYDRNMKIFAMSATVDTIYISPIEIEQYGEDPQLIARTLSDILDVDYERILEMTEDTKSWYKTIARRVDEETAQQVRDFKNEYNLVGVKLEADTKRYYPYGSLAAHVVGFVGHENSGLSGIESVMDDVLTGISGRVVRAKNARGTDMLFTKFEDYYDAEDGYDVVLTIDSTIQYYVEKHLEQAIADYGVSNGAAAIAMDVKTGGILAMASYGNFDLNNYQLVSDDVQELIASTEDETVRSALLSDAQQLQWRNKALSDTYEPGSTFKIITLAMALEENVASLESSYYCGGSIQIAGDTHVRNCWNIYGHGQQTLLQSIQHSCNVSIINIGVQVGNQRFYEYAEAFGFLQRTGIELSGEANGIWWNKDYFTRSTTVSELAAASFGQTFTITPLQLVTAISACVNGGYLMQPYLVSEVRDGDGNIVSKNEPVVKRQVISEQTSRVISQILEQVVCDTDEGTGKNAYVSGYKIGGKTGTSTNTVMEVMTGEKQYIVSFVGVAPTDDPQICILVLLDCPNEETGYVSGGNMAAPAVGNMLADILPYLGVEASFSEDELINRDKTVPNIINMPLDRAQQALSDAGLSYRVIGSGGVVSAQLPTANYVIAANSEVLIYLGTEPSGGVEEVPNLVGLTYAQARIQLGYLGLYIKTNSNSIRNSGYIVVTRQSVPEGEEVPHGTVIEVSLVDGDISIYGRY